LEDVVIVSEQDVLTKVYAEFNARNIDSILAVMHPEVKWPNGWEGGWVYGHDAVREYWTRQWQALDPRVDPVSFDTDERGRTIVNVHAVVRDLSGRIVSDGTVQHIYSIEDGLIREMEIRTVAS
jgi:hypothetical protein